MIKIIKCEAYSSVKYAIKISKSKKKALRWIKKQNINPFSWYEIEKIKRKELLKLYKKGRI